MVPLLFGLISAVSTMSGGMLPLYTRIRDIGSRYLLGFAAGVMLSVAFLEMLPEMAEQGKPNFVALAVGYFSVYLVEKLVMVHSCPEGECEVHTIGWTALIGIGAESLLDGVAIGIGFHLAPEVGLTIALAVLIHEFPRGFATTVIMRNADYTLRRIWGALSIDALFTPLGVVLVLVGLFPQGLFMPLLGFAAGTFIYVGASDLLPEAHRTFNIWVVASVILGLLLVPALEPVVSLAGL